MDVNGFNSELLSALSRIELIERIELETEAIVVKGRAYINASMFLEIYFNEITETTAFALINEQK